MIKTIKILRENLEKKMVLEGAKSRRAFAIKSAVDPKTINNILTANPNPNASMTINILERIADKSNVEPWMFLVKNFPYEGNRPKKINQLIQISTELNDEDLQDLLVIAESKYETHKIRQELARYDASNPLLKSRK